MAESSKLLSVYLAIGKDALKRRRVLERFKARLDGPFAEFNYDEIQASKTMDSEALERLIASLEQLPFAAGQRLVVIQDAQELPREVQEGIVTYLASPNPDASLLLLAESWDKRTRFYKAIAAVGKQALIHCDPPSNKGLLTEVIKLAGSFRLTLGYSEAKELVDRVGKDTAMLDRALRTLRELYPEASRLTIAHIQKSVSRTETPGPWVVADAVAARDLKGALSALASAGEAAAIVIHSLLSRRLKELLIAKELEGEGKAAELPKALGFSQAQAWRCKNHLQNARRFTRKELVDALDGALACEQALKGSSDSTSALIVWVINICRRSAPAQESIRLRGRLQEKG